VDGGGEPRGQDQRREDAEDFEDAFDHTVLETENPEEEDAGQGDQNGDIHVSPPASA
jgi:hypothetical protein